VLKVNVPRVATTTAERVNVRIYVRLAGCGLLLQHVPSVMEMNGNHTFLTSLRVGVARKDMSEESAWDL
jgi:hypothetical protein